jgi:Acetyltransferase (GNAT) domain
MPRLPLPDPPLSDAEIVLRAWTLSDVPALTVACQDPEIPRWTVVPSPYTERHARDYIAGCAEDRDVGRELALAIAGQGDTLLGAIGIGRFDWDDHKAEIGYWIAREARRSARGRRACSRAGRSPTSASSGWSCWRTPTTRRRNGSPSGRASGARACCGAIGAAGAGARIW